MNKIKYNFENYYLKKINSDQLGSKTFQILHNSQNQLDIFHKSFLNW
jgi:hypothetical protein